MEEYEYENTNKGETVDEIDFEPISIEQNEEVFTINIESNNKDYISLSINAFFTIHNISHNSSFYY